MPLRAICTAILASALLVGGMLVPTAGARDADVPTPTVTRRLDGLPPAARASAYAEAGAPVESEVTRTPIPFSMVGFELPVGADVEFRTSRDGRSWSPWEHAHRHDDEVPDAASSEAAGAARAVLSAPTWVGAAEWLQTRVVGARPDAVSVHLIDSAGLSRSLGQRVADAVTSAWRGSPAHAASAPTIVSRAQWGADESMRTGAVRAARRARVGFVHHTAGSSDYAPSDGPAIVRGIYAYHVRSNGWDDIGYNLLVDRYGRVYEGRYGGIERAVVGAHAGGFNTGTFGVAVLGTFETGPPPQAAVDALAQVLAWKMELHHIDPLTRWEMTSGGSTRYSAGTRVLLDTIAGHRDVSSTACPGAALYRELPALRQQVDRLIGAAIYDHDASPAAVRVEEGTVANGPVTFTTRLRPEGPWTLEVRDPQGAVVHSDAGVGAVATSTWRPPQQPPLGRYTYTFASPGRLSASDSVDLVNHTLERVGASGDAIVGAVEASLIAFPQAGSAGSAVLARADVFADALAGGPLAGADGPLLLTGSGALDARVREELDRVLPPGSTVYVLGGSAAISEDVVNALSTSWTVRRLSGAERTATAAEVARVVVARSASTTALIARAGPDSAAPWADALAGGSYGAARGVPVLLTPTDRLAVPAETVLRELGITNTIVLGGTAAVSEAVARQLPGPRRVAGADRTHTAVAIAEQLWGRTTAGQDQRLLLGGAFRGDAWSFALASAPLAARMDAPLLLTSSASLSSATAAYLDRLAYQPEHAAKGWVLGSREAVSDAAASEAGARLQ